MPKVELHVHLEGSITPDMLLTLAERNRLNLDCDTTDKVTSLYRSIRDFDTFKRALLFGARCLQCPEDFEFAVRRLGKLFAAQNIVYAEVYWTPQLHAGKGLPIQIILEAMNAGRSEIQRETGVEIRWIPDIVRSYPAPAYQVVKWATSEQARNGGVVALGLAGPESGFPAQGFAGVFSLARARGLPANPHAGEGTSPQSIAETLKSLEPCRIGHGISAVEDPALLCKLAQTGLPLEICLTSNVRLGHYSDYAAHPLRHLLDAGCNVSINTDDPALFGTTLTEEYQHAARECGVSLPEIDQIILDAVEASYLTGAEKSVLRSSIVRQQSELKLECRIQQ